MVEDFTKHQLFLLLLLVGLVSGVAASIITFTLLGQTPPPLTQTIQRIIQAPKSTIPPEDVVTLEKAALARDLLIQDIARRVSPAVVSIIATKDVPIIEQSFVSPFSEQQVSAGTGFFVSGDGFIVTNKHVVEDTEAEYSVITNDGKKFVARVVARDPLHDMAVVKIEGKNFPSIPLADSDAAQIGQTVIAIGNALGEFQNTVSVGVVSGLGRQLVANGLQSGPEQLTQLIQTDAAINPGNSGGPLLNLKGEVLGLDTAIAQGAQNIGFAIPINQIKKSLTSAQKTGKIVYPFIGVRHVLITPDIQEKNKLPVNYGAWVTKGPNGEAAVTSGSPAEKAGIKEGDIILEFGGTKITTDTTLTGLIQQHQVGETVKVKIMRDGKEMTLSVTLEERK